MESIILPIRPPTLTHFQEGKKLLQEHRLGLGPLSDQDCDLIAAHLDQLNPGGVLLDNFGKPYKSVDLNIGERKDSVELGHHAQTESHSSLEHFDSLRQRQFFDFVKSDARIEYKCKRSHAWIKIPGVERQFYAFQLYAAVLMVVEERGPRRGIIETDQMGLGKVSLMIGPRRLHSSVNIPTRPPPPSSTFS